MKKIFFTISLLAYSVATVHAQSDANYTPYNNFPAIFGRQTMNGGTARYTAIGGAGVSLGADLGAAYVNPAGLGMYRKSEFSFSPNFGFSGSNTSFIDPNNSTSDDKGSFGISNLGIALCSNKSDLDKSDWRGGTFSLGMSRTNSFHNRISFRGTDEQSSMSDAFVEQANGIPVSEIEQEDPYSDAGSGIFSLPALAYYSYLIGPTGPEQYTNYKQFEIFDKEATYTTKGSQQQWNIAYGANYKDKLFIGGTLGINSINHRQDLSYTEISDYSYNPDDSTYMFDDFTYNENIKTKGTGINLKLGYIYKISDVVRIGSTVTSPTYYWMNEQTNMDVTVNFPSYLLDDYGNPLGTTAEGGSNLIKYNYTTPAKIAIGTSFFAGKAGFFSADLEYVPYQLSDLSPRNKDLDFDSPLTPRAKAEIKNTFSNANNFISQQYKNTLNLRLGGELRLDIFRLRAGLAYLPTPYQSNDNVKRDIAQISGGVGVRLNDAYFDLGLVNSRFESSYQPYTLNTTTDLFTGDFITAPTAISKNSLTNVVLTVGFYFE